MQSKINKQESDPVLAKMFADLISCRLAPGMQIREAQAATHYGTSRTKLREAFINLAARGFIRLEKNKGAIVAPMDAATVFSVFEARISSEKAAAALAAVRATPSEKQALSAFVDELHDAEQVNDINAFFAIDRSVHEAIGACARNPFIAAQVHTMRAHTARCWHFYRERGLKEKADFTGVAAIVKAVGDGNPKQSADGMHKHLALYLMAFNDMLAKQFEALKWV